MLWKLCTVGFLHFLVCLHVTSSTEPEVSLQFGQLRGSVEMVDGKEVHRFLGIPYAKPPVGNLRFKKPVPFEGRWESTLDATKWPNVCEQPLVELISKTFVANKSEDCLYLNIWVPNANYEALEGKLKPVLIFIHGGAYFIHSASSITHDGGRLAARTGVVVITLNYRLGALGFLYGHDEAAPGNVGLWDQLVALEWVQNNVRYFGGDPDQVTVSGESAGGMSVTMHVMSPLSGTLFQNAIIMSGPVVDKLPTTSKSHALAKASQLAAVVGCRTLKGTEPLTTAELDCLRKLPADVISMSQFADDVIRNGTFVDFWPFRPIYGDAFLPNSPIQAITSGMFKRNARVLIGTVENEGITYDVLMGPHEKSKLPSTRNEWFERTMSIVNNTDLGCPQLHERLVESFFYSALEDDEPTKAKVAHYKALGSLSFHCPTNFLAEHLAKSNQVYQYLFTVSSETTAFCRQEEYKPCHGDDVFFTFGVLLSSPKDVAISEEWMDLLAKLVKDEKMPMPKYSMQGNRLLSPYYVFRGNNSNRVNFGLNYYSCSFWKDALLAMPPSSNLIGSDLNK